jgi:very-short-patch-repair endonuclease
MGAVVCGYIVDALFVTERVIVELDSAGFHNDPIAFETDRERDAETLANGFVTLRITKKRMAAVPEREAERLSVILARRRGAQAA